MSERRFRADSRLVYSQALLELVRYARESQAVFWYGPTSLARLENEGLLVTGPDADAAAGRVMWLPGLVEFGA